MKLHEIDSSLNRLAEGDNTFTKIIKGINLGRGISDLAKNPGDIPVQVLRSLIQKAKHDDRPFTKDDEGLFNWKKKKRKKPVGESATAGATSAGNIATVASVPGAYRKIKRDKNGIPKAPQATNPDGTAKNALNLNNNIMGGKPIKR